MSPSPSLEKAIDRVYRAFASHPKPHHIDGCPCCLDREEIGVLLGKRLRDLSPEELAPYAASAFLTVGEAGDYLYFLPRILEITALEPSWWPDPEVTGRAILSSLAETWTAEQRDALHAFLEAVVEAILRSGSYHEIDSWICAIGRMGLDVRPFLDQVATRREAVLDYFETNAAALKRKTLFNAFWERTSPAHDAVIAWFYSDEIAKFPSEAYRCDFRESEPEGS